MLAGGDAGGLGAVPLWREGEHFRIDAFEILLAGGWRRALELAIALLGPYCVRIVAIRKAILYAGIAIVALVGAYAATYSIFQMAPAIVFGVVAYFLRKQGYPSVALLLGPDLEQFFRRSLSLNDGNPMVFLTSPDSLFFLGLTLVFIWFMVIRPPRVVARLPEEVGGG